MSTAARLVGISSLAHFRAAGWLPWLVLALWSAASAAGEPLALRSFGIRITDQAISAGTTVVAAILLLSCRAADPPCRWLRLATNLLVMAAASLAHLLVGFACSIAAGHPGSIPEHLVAAGCFLWAWSPSAAALGLRAEGRTQSIMNKSIMATSLGVSVTTATRTWLEPVDAWLLLGPAMCMAACVLAMIAKPPPRRMIHGLPCA